MAGSQVVIHVRFDPARYIEDAVRYRVTSIGGAPPVYVALLQVPGIYKADLSSVLGFATGAAPLPVPLIEKMKAPVPGAKVGEGYGLTEVTMRATCNPGHATGVRKAGHGRRPLSDTEISSGRWGRRARAGGRARRGLHPRPAGDARLPQAADATAESIDADGWFRTGDIGALDDDGYLTIVDRKKDMLIYKGYNVYPRELEELLYATPASLPPPSWASPTRRPASCRWPTWCAGRTTRAPRSPARA